MDSSTGSPNHNSLSVGGPPPINFSHDLLCPPDLIGTALTVAGTRSYNRRMETYSLFLTWRFDTALQFASGLHHQQPRKGVSIPYIAHLMSVCALVLEAGGDEDQAIAALLHDAVEDQGGLPTLDTIRHLFGKRVANAVRECSDCESSDSNNKPYWKQSK